MSSCIFSFLTFCLNMKPPTEPNGRQIIVAVVQPDYFINAKYYSSNFKKRHLFSLIFLCRSKNNNLPSFIQFFNSQLFKTQQNLIVKEIDVTAPKRAHLEQYFYLFFHFKTKETFVNQHPGNGQTNHQLLRISKSRSKNSLLCRFTPKSIPVISPSLVLSTILVFLPLSCKLIYNPPWHWTHSCEHILSKKNPAVHLSF